MYQILLNQHLELSTIIIKYIIYRFYYFQEKNKFYYSFSNSIGTTNVPLYNIFNGLSVL